MSKTNSRRSPRVFCGAPARADGPRGPIRGICRNLSVGGMFFSGPTLPVGKAMDFAIELAPGAAVRATGEVRYHHQYPDGSGVGVRFVRIAAEDLELLGEYVQAAAA